jgi:O-glycosyl hydrolase
VHAIAATAIFSAVSPASGQVKIEIDKTYQVMQGFGSSSRVWDDPHVSNAPRTTIPAAARAEILTRLYKDLGLTRVRPVFDGEIEPVNDNDDPMVFDWSKFNFEWKRNDAHVDFVKEARPYGVEVYFPSPVVLEKWMTEHNPDEYVEWALAILLRWRQLGQELPFFSVINEPGYKRSGIWSARWMRAVVKGLGARMRAAGLKTMLVVPDDVNPTEAYRRAREILEDADARPYVGALAYHLYGASNADLRAMQTLAATYGLPVWMTEFGDPHYADYAGALKWATTVHTLISEYGVSAVDYMWGFFGDHDPGWALIAVTFRHGEYKGYALTPAYYVTGHFSRFVRPGHVRVGARSEDPGVLVSGYRGGSDLVIVVINPGQDQKQVSLRFSGGPVPDSLSPVVTSRTERWKAMPPVPVQEGGFNVVLPPQSITTLIGTRTSGR